MSMKVIRSTSCKSISDSIQIHQHFCKLMAQKFLLSRIIVTLNQGQSDIDWYLNIECSSIYHQTKFESKRFKNVRIHAKVKGFFSDAFSKTAVISLHGKKLTQKQRQSVQLELLQYLVKFHSIQWNRKQENEANML